MLGEVKMRLDRRENFFANPVVEPQTRRSFDVVAFGPDLVLAEAVDELDRETHASVHAADAAVDEIADAEPADDLADAERLSLQGKT